MKKLLLVLTPLIIGAVSCATHHQHAANHPHNHGPNCGHPSVAHDGHTDYLDDGHLHNPDHGHYDDHVIAVSTANPDQCTPGHGKNEQPAGHIHSTVCGHAAVPHGNHTDYAVNGHLHHPHADHCDNHGPLLVSQ